MSELRLTEIFYSLQGESNFVGLPTVFIRTTGCPLRCQYCDSEYAFNGGSKWTLASILEEVKKYNTQYITLTGGEPMAQKAQSLALMENLVDLGYTVSLETSGSIDLSGVNPKVVRIIDIKTPDSNESSRNFWGNLDNLREHDQVKFVICSKDDYEWSKSVIKEYELTNQPNLLFSPSFNEVSLESLAEWILEDQLPVRLQSQLHKTIWGDVPGK